MDAMGFGSLFKIWVEMLHADNVARFILGSLTDPIRIAFSVRQGDLIALLLYLIFIEPLLLRIKRWLPGFYVGNARLQQFPYVDDNTGFFKSSSELRMLAKILEDFEGVSGALLSQSVGQSVSQSVS